MINTSHQHTNRQGTVLSNQSWSYGFHLDASVCTVNIKYWPIGLKIVLLILKPESRAAATSLALFHGCHFSFGEKLKCKNDKLRFYWGYAVSWTIGWELVGVATGCLATVWWLQMLRRTSSARGCRSAFSKMSSYPINPLHDSLKWGLAVFFEGRNIEHFKYYTSLF